MERIWLKSYPKGVASEVDVDALGTISDVFDRAVEQFKDHKGFTSVNTVQTYGETKEKVDLFSSFLQNELGLKKGDRIAIMLPNCLQYPIVVLGALQIGAVIVNVNPLYTATELAHQLADAEPTTIVIIENFAKTLEKALPKIPSLENIILASIGDQLHSFWGYLLNFAVRH
ncbi:MAG: AMP-binding protein, partial [Neisseriaceae bacterium]|nr:AMP-binding protein [Neisseriaceae bacterium]